MVPTLDSSLSIVNLLDNYSTSLYLRLLTFIIPNVFSKQVATVSIWQPLKTHQNTKKLLFNILIISNKF